MPNGVKSIAEIYKTGLAAVAVAAAAAAVIVVVVVAAAAGAAAAAAAVVVVVVVVVVRMRFYFLSAVFSRLLLSSGNTRKYWFRKTNLSNSLVQLCPSPEYPSLHVQVYDPGVLLQTALTSQLSVLIAHSSISVKIK